MPEHARSFTVTVEIDSNKQTYTRAFSWAEDVGTDDVFTQAREWADDVIESM